MNKRRLLKLAGLLEADAKNRKGIKFDLATWGYAIDEPPSATCNTHACAIGLACISGAFKRAGLECAPNELGYGKIEPRCGKRYGWNAVTYVFGLKKAEAHFLFNANFYPEDETREAIGERIVAKRIRAFVAGKVSA